MTYAIRVRADADGHYAQHRGETIGVRPTRQEAARDEAERGPVPAPTCSCGVCLVCALEAGRRWR